jgi:predicted  nucleic acid-binding Zn-ribbon protein
MGWHGPCVSGAVENATLPWSDFFILQEIDAQLDQLREQLELASLLADDGNGHLDAEIANARRTMDRLHRQLCLREEQRAETVATLAGPHLSHYERLRRRVKIRPWVVRLTGPVCPACNVALPSTLVADAERTGEPASCPGCQRLLLWQARTEIGPTPAA